MRRLRRLPARRPKLLVVGLLAIGLLVAVKPAVTAGNSISPVQLDYRDTTITGANLLHLVYGLDANGKYIKTATITLKGDMTGRNVTAWFNTDSSVTCPLGAFNGTSTAASCTGFNEYPGPPNAFHIQVVIPTTTCDQFSTSASTTTLANRFVQPAASCGNYQWVVPRGVWQNGNGKAWASAVVSGQAWATVNAPSSINASVEVTVTNLTTCWAGLALNAQPGAPILGVGLQTGSNNVGIFTIGSAPGFVLTLITSATVLVNPTGDNRLRATRNGSSVTVSVNGAVALTWTLTAPQLSLSTGGYHGIASCHISARFDDFLVTPATAP